MTGDSEAQIHSVLHGDENGRAVFGGIPDDRDDDDADEDVAHAEGVCGFLDRMDEDLADPGDERRGANQDEERFL